MQPWFIYALVDPRTGAIRYVGRTTRTLAKRLGQHLTSRERCHRGCWIRSLLAAGLRPGISLLEEGAGPGVEVAERRWIASMLAEGADLTNGTVGGETANSFTAEARERIGAPQRGRRFTPEHREKLRLSHLGKNNGPEMYRKCREKMLGRKLSDATRANMSAAQRGRLHGPMPAEQRAKIAAALAGKPKSSAHVEALRDAWVRRRGDAT